MRQLKPILFTVFALAALVVSCIEPLDIVAPDGRNRFPEGALILSPQVLGVPATKVPIAGVEGQKENKLASLDIFVYRKVEGSNVFFHRYTLSESETQQLISGQDYLLESNWRTAKYPDNQGAGYEGNTFKIYVLANLAVNNRDDIPASPTEAQLRAFVSTSKQTIEGSYDVVRLVDGKGPGTDDGYNPHIADNLFLMDGVIDNWTPDNSSSQQYFTNKTDKTFELARAAAKFEVTLDFDPAFLAILGTADADKLNFTKTEYWPGTEVKMTEVVTSIGNMQYKYSNFLPATYDFDPEGAVPATVLKTFRDDNLWESTYRYDFSYRTPTSTAGTFKYPYIDTTYSYAFSWDDSEAAEKAPALAASIIYTRTTRHYDASGNLVRTDDPVKETNYYRIPLVDVISSTDPVTAVERNTFYQVDALISSMGATTIDIEPTPVKLSYKVIPWSFNEATDITEVEGAELYYFTADTVFTLRGEYTQTVDLDYFTPQSELQNNHYLFEPKLSNFRVYYVPAPGDTTFINRPTSNPGTYTYNTSTTTNRWTGAKTNSGETVTINVLPANDGGGQVKISSEVLANRAVKHIEFVATVTFRIPILDNDGVPTGEYNTVNVVRHYHILHFPLDNIQSVTGSWSSRTSDVTASAYSYSFVNRTGYSREPAGTTHYFTYQEYQTYGNTYITRTLYSGEVSGLDYTDHNSEQNGIYVTFTDGSKGNCWRERSWNSYDYYIAIYTNRNRMYRRAYDHHWIDWDTDQTGSFSESDAKLTYDGGRFVAKVFDASAQQVFPLVASRTGSLSSQNESSYSYSQATIIQGTFYFYSPDGYVSSGNNYSNLTNNHMYVIQISKAGIDKNGDPVIIGRPLLDNNSQSNDNVVSPAFMIASQLGAVTSYTQYTDDDALAAAIHCRTYMEVGTNGRRFTGWRLPTQAEIKYIVEYQSNDAISGAGVFEDVLKGGHYYTLNYLQSDSNRRRYTDTNYFTDYSPGDDDYDDTYAVRCIRDLTPEEVAELNSTGNITTATY